MKEGKINKYGAKFHLRFFIEHCPSLLVKTRGRKQFNLSSPCKKTSSAPPAARQSYLSWQAPSLGASGGQHAAPVSFSKV